METLESAIRRLAGLAVSTAIVSLAVLPTQAATWVPIKGNVRLADGTPICAMVLANGQYMFSCGENGAYNLNVPVDDKGQVTLFAFADGFAPFRVTAGPARLPAVVRTRTADPDSPVIAMTRDMECAANNWVRISGEIESERAEPLCAMVLANGQHMFSCGASQGRYDLTVPADENGNVTVFGFADGFQPYSETFVAPECYAALSTTENGVEISAQITGGNYPFFGDCQLVITAKNTTTIIKDVAVFWDAWDSSGEAVGGPPASFYLRAGVTDTAYSWATYHDDKALDCGSISRLEFIEVSVDDVKMAR